MSFGVSIGDFIAVGELVVKIIDMLHGTQPEYQELSRELEGLRRALSQVDKLKGRGIQAIAVDQIKCAALTCKYPLEQFLAKIQRYDKNLGLVKSNDKIKNAVTKVQFGFKEKTEANTLRNYLNIHIGTINMLLIRQGLETLDVVSECIDKNHEELRVRIEDSTKELREIRGNAQAQAFAVEENNSMLRKLFWMISGDFTAPLRALSQTVAKVCVSTQQIYIIVLELRANLPGIDTRFTHFQDPVRVEDVLGRVFHFSSECSIDALYAEIRARFKEGHGMAEVMAGNFEIFNAKDSEQVLTTSGLSTLLPGMSVNMAIILEEFTGDDKCPMPRCPSKSFVNVIGGGRTCSECKVWFDGVSKQRKEDLKISKHIKTRDRNEAKRPKIFQEAGLLGDEETTENLQSDSEETSISAFKRIRFESGLQAEAAAALPVTTPVPPPAAADASKAAPPSKEKDKPIRFRDGIGRRFSFPFDICKTWSGMENLIKEAFLYVADLGPRVANGQYDLLGPKDEIIMPSIWELVIQPGWEITMHMWPIPEPPPDGGDALAGGMANIVIVEPGMPPSPPGGRIVDEKNGKKKKEKIPPFMVWTAGKSKKGRRTAKGKK